MDGTSEHVDRQFLKSDNGQKMKLKYPHHLDNKLQYKIAIKKEFQFKYDGMIKDILEEEKKGNLCGSEEFQLSPHQKFVKAFISDETPYNGLLLYHGLGSGKTCSAIGISEQFRSGDYAYLKKRHVYIIASPNVQENFKLQLFDKEKLVKQNGKWQLNGCVGPDLLRQLDGFDIDSFPKETLVKKLEKIIFSSYKFMGYEKFSNYVNRITQRINTTGLNGNRRLIKMKHELNKKFSNSLIIIDEVHNVRISQDSETKKVAITLLKLVQNVSDMKLLFLSGTPMYNDPREIIFIINLLRFNDNLSNVNASEIFDTSGKLLNRTGKEEGKKKLIQICGPYISYVRGENPYSFPFKVFPYEFDKTHSMKEIIHKNQYPGLQFNQKAIKSKINFLDTYVTQPGEVQRKGYQSYIEQLYSSLSEKEIERFSMMDTFGYSYLQEPLKYLSICYQTIDEKGKIEYSSGGEGLSQTMIWDVNRTENKKFNYEYIANDGEIIFKMENLHKYSSKISSIMKHVMNSKGIVLIYSQYIDAGLVPIALALEELGMKRLNHNSLLKPRNDLPKLNSITMTEDNDVKGIFKQCKYAMITGNIFHSPKGNNVKELKIINSTDNLWGHECKVVLISQAGSEGIDFKNLRQVHILEPWYNLNRIEQIVGRAIRNCSHKQLPLQQRNTQIFLHSSVMNLKTRNPREEIECIDTMIYRYAEKKSELIGHVQRVLKSVSVDCLLNIGQTNFSKFLDQDIPIQLADRQKITYNIKDKSYSSLCDFQEKCDHKCINNINVGIIESDYSTLHAESIRDNSVVRKVAALFSDRFVLSYKEILSKVKRPGISRNHIEYALNEMLQKRYVVVDRYMRKGHVVSISDYYIFQPCQLVGEHVALHDNITPLLMKIKYLVQHRLQNKSDEKRSTAEEHAKRIAQNIEAKEITLNANNKETKKTFRNSWEMNRLISDIKLKITEGTNNKSQYDSDDIYESFTPVAHRINSITKNISLSSETAHKILIQMIVDRLEIQDELLLLRYLLLNKHSLDVDESIIFTYLQTNLIHDPSTESYLYLTVNLKESEEGKNNVLIFKVENTTSAEDFYLKKATQLDIEQFGGIQQIYMKILDKSKIEKIKQRYNVFISYSKKNEALDVKVKDNKIKRSGSGAFFADKPPKKMMPILNEMVGEDVFIQTNKAQDIKGKNNRFSKQEWCLILEIIARFFSLQSPTSHDNIFLSKVKYELMR